jgi:hypothetical protein
MAFDLKWRQGGRLQAQQLLLHILPQCRHDAQLGCGSAGCAPHAGLDSTVVTVVVQVLLWHCTFCCACCVPHHHSTAQPDDLADGRSNGPVLVAQAVVLCCCHERSVRGRPYMYCMHSVLQVMWTMSMAWQPHLYLHVRCDVVIGKNAICGR